MEVAGETLGPARVRVLKDCTMLLIHHDSRDPDPDGETFERYLKLQPGDEIVVIGPTGRKVERMKMDGPVFEIIKAGGEDLPPNGALYTIRQTYPDGSGARLIVDWPELLRLQEMIQERIDADRQLVER